MTEKTSAPMEVEARRPHLVATQAARLYAGPTLPSLRTILSLPAFRGAQLICGRNHLEQPVTWVHIAEVMDVWRFLTGGELLLSTGLELARSTPAARAGYVQKLARAGTRALVLELVQWLTNVPEDMLEAARAENFALIVFRSEVSYRELTQAAHREILVPARPRAQESALQTVVNALVDTRRDRAFIRSELGALLALPPRPRMTLLATLEVLLEVHFNITAAARMLGIRRQTVYYRLDQLTGLLGSLEDPSRKLGFLVALALLKQQALKTEESTTAARSALR